MSSTRQSELFAGESWTVLYRAFTQINFNASDPPSINAALRSYIQTNYPEDFNDWIASSEFVAIIDLLSWLAGNLAFKTDIAARENFLETAEARESILRLARFLSYNPSRNRSASGVLKLVQISTDDDVFDSFGTNLANTVISWNNPDDPNWYERFVTILNNAFISTNPFGIPLKSGTVGDLATQTYRLNALAAANNLSFSATVAGQGMGFELVNGDFVDGGSFFEKAPSPYAGMSLFYLNDANGNASALTGFFMPFKQGSTSANTFAIVTPVENQVIDIGVGGVNQEDVWVQTVTDTGTILTDWIKVPTVLNSNITYNNLPIDQRNIFSVLTRDDDQISIRFSDGRFGNAPVGNIRVTYRTSNGLTYLIKAQDIDLISMPFTFVTPSGASKTLTMVFSLQQTVSNSSPAETEAQIAQRAPGVYSTQNRMVSGEDYNNFPLSQNLAVKIKAVNRIYSGHSRYFDLNDPTGTYQDLSIFADDGIFFSNPANVYNEIPTSLNRTPSELLGYNIQPLLQTTSMINYVRDYFMGLTRSGSIPAVNLTWTQSQATLYSSTGSLSGANSLIQPGAMLQYFDTTQNRNRWIGVKAIAGSINIPPPANSAGPVTLAGTLPTGTVILKVLPRYAGTITSAIVPVIQDKLAKKLSFSLWYDYSAPNAEWSVRTPASLDTTVSPNPPDKAILLMTVDYLSGLWRVQARGLQYIFESGRSVRFYDSGRRDFDQKTGAAALDSISVLKINSDPNDNSGYSLRRNYGLSVGELFYYINGTVDPKRVYVTFLDSDNDGFPDDPDLFYLITSNSLSHSNTPGYKPNAYLFWYSSDGSATQVPFYDMYVYETDNNRMSADPNVMPNTPAPPFGSHGYVLETNTFWTYTEDDGWVEDFTGTYSVGIGRGPNVAVNWLASDGFATTPVADEGINFQWKHYAPSDHRIDPSSTNIHDIFVLTSAYDTAIRLWIAAGAIASDIPKPPTELELRTSFASLETYRMFSDAIVWRPMRYKFLFGNGADNTLKAQFKVVKLQNTSVSDGEIKSRIIRAINTFFEVTRWDFGETFYFTEMAAYIHQQLAGIIGSFVIVPLNASGTFGDGFEVTSRADEIFVSTAQVSDIVIIDSNTPANLRIKV